MIKARVTAKSGGIVHGGWIIKDQRGQEWTFVGVSAMPAPERNYDGRVLVTDEFGREREFLPCVFSVTITEYQAG